MNRYEQRAKAIAFDLEIREALGLVVLVTRSTEQQAVAAAVAAEIAAATCVELSVDTIDAMVTGDVLVVPGLPRPDAQLRHLNERRDRLIFIGCLVVMVVDMDELPRLQIVCGDAYSRVAVVHDIAFEPRTGVSEAEGRLALAKAYDRRYGQLDLRGFIRNEREDVAWRVEDLYQDTRASWDEPPLSLGIQQMLPLFDGRGSQILADMLAARRHDDRPVVVLGHPGSGKTFFLRWCALRGASEDIFGVERPLPVLVPLAAYAAAPGPRTLRQFALDLLLRDAPEAAHVLDQAIGEGRVVFLLDGLDEVGSKIGWRICSNAISELVKAAPGCSILITCRVASWADAPLNDVNTATLSPFDNEGVHTFLRAWCGLYAVMLGGEEKRAEGEELGEKLAREVLAQPTLSEMARTPLLLTVLAIVHRAGVRLPDHRVELYDHILTVLVERWNTVRSLTQVGGAVPIRAVDAQRLLGPVALAMVRRGERGSITRGRLRAHLETALERGRLRALTTADEAIDLFQKSIGLIAEQAPDRFGFLHLSLVEALAARELVRTGELEALVSDPTEAFKPQWREILLLAAGELGLLRGEDTRLDDLVDTLVASAGSRRGRPSPAVPSLLGGLLADDPSLGSAAAEKLVAELIPRWWFERRYHPDSQMMVWGEALEFLRTRLRQGRQWRCIQDRIQGIGLDLKELAQRGIQSHNIGLFTLTELFSALELPLLALLSEVPKEHLPSLLIWPGIRSAAERSSLVFWVKQSYLGTLQKLNYVGIRVETKARIFSFSFGPELENDPVELGSIPYGPFDFELVRGPS